MSSDRRKDEASESDSVEADADWLDAISDVENPEVVKVAPRYWGYRKIKGSEGTSPYQRRGSGLTPVAA